MSKWEKKNITMTPVLTYDAKTVPTEDELKKGARNNSKDQERLQGIHDYAVENGAKCRTISLQKSFDVDPEDTVISFGGEFKSLGEGKFGGYLVRFTTPEDPDLTGDFFTKETDFDLEFPGKATVYFNHGLDPELKKRKLGKADIRLDDVGIWAEFLWQERDAYEKALEEMGMAGKLGWSSGTAAHLVEREQVGKAMFIKKWPLGLDASITHTPAEPRNVVIPLKSLSVLITPEEPKADADSTAQEGTQETVKNSTGDTNMEDKDIEKLVADTAEKSAAAAIKAYVAAQPSEHETVQVIEDEADRASKEGFKSAGEFFMAVKNAALRPDGIDKRLLPLKAAAGANESVPSEGGFLVHSTIAPGIFERMYNTGTLLNKFAVDQVGPNSNGMTYNAIDETSRADGSRYGGVQGYWLNEAGTKTSSKPSFRQVELKLKKVVALAYATDELLEDATALQSWIMRTVPEELRFKVEDAIVNGDGVGKPLGYTNSPAVIALNPTTINTAIAADVLGMWARRWVGATDYIWLCDQSVIPQLATMTVGQMPVWLPPSGLIGNAQQGTLLGRPLYEVEYCAALSSTDYFLHLVSPSQYALIGKGGIQAAESIHVKFVTDETAFRFVYRIDGEPYWNTTLTTKSGTTVSPFILLGSTTP
jgi:HK97 family phage major capsid protein